MKQNKQSKTFLMSSDIGLQEGMFLLQVLNTGQVLSIVIGDQLTFDLAQPHLDILNAPKKIDLMR